MVPNHIILATNSKICKKYLPSFTWQVEKVGVAISKDNSPSRCQPATTKKTVKTSAASGSPWHAWNFITVTCGFYLSPHHAYEKRANH
ncbi:hypothetical protein GBAR_LOCUS14479 [Geodia barretti]|uniref:Uncharacterized protein n=1 Tax=Geodia barretti TaxID=519541 RepID=A0AA35S8A2_GEOBA|nr:hypothetical protein GBAR_LOCUS14479 [Geodia barretti]